MTTHTLKTWPEYYDAIVRGDKTFEYRLNDRDFLVGDTLNLLRWDPQRGVYTGEDLQCLVTFIYPVKDMNKQDRVIMAIQVLQ